MAAPALQASRDRPSAGSSLTHALLFELARQPLDVRVIWGLVEEEY